MLLWIFLIKLKIPLIAKQNGWNIVKKKNIWAFYKSLWQRLKGIWNPVRMLQPLSHPIKVWEDCHEWKQCRTSNWLWKWGEEKKGSWPKSSLHYPSLIWAIMEFVFSVVEKFQVKDWRWHQRLRLASGVPKLVIFPQGFEPFLVFETNLASPCPPFAKARRFKFSSHSFDNFGFSFTAHLKNFLKSYSVRPRRPDNPIFGALRRHWVAWFCMREVTFFLGHLA